MRCYNCVCKFFRHKILLRCHDICGGLCRGRLAPDNLKHDNAAGWAFAFDRFPAIFHDLFESFGDFLLRLTFYTITFWHKEIPLKGSEGPCKVTPLVYFGGVHQVNSEKSRPKALIPIEGKIDRRETEERGKRLRPFHVNTPGRSISHRGFSVEILHDLHIVMAHEIIETSRKRVVFAPEPSRGGVYCFFAMRRFHG
jgi:hypothetical protein